MSRDFRAILGFILFAGFVVVRSDDDKDEDKDKLWPEKIHMSVVSFESFLLKVLCVKTNPCRSMHFFHLL